MPGPYAMVLMMNAVKKLAPSAEATYPTTTLVTVPPTNPPTALNFKTAPCEASYAPTLYLAVTARSCHLRGIRFPAESSHGTLQGESPDPHPETE